MDSVKMEQINKTTMSLQELDREQRKLDQTKMNLKKIES
jgi:hypothetical protein